jgi:hypothetical protein
MLKKNVLEGIARAVFLNSIEMHGANIVLSRAKIIAIRIYLTEIIFIFQYNCSGMAFFDLQYFGIPYLYDSSLAKMYMSQ